MQVRKIENAFLTAKTDKANTHGYHIPYSEIFSRVEPKSILEVGVKQGRSLAAWRMIFPNAKISGVDITDRSFESEMIEFADAEIVIEDSTKPDILKQINEHDVVIDDGSHYYKDIIDTFTNLHKNFSKAYVIEDVMYGLEEILDHIRSLGYTDVKVYESNVKNVPVFLWWLMDPRNKIDSKETVLVNLKMVVVYR